MQGLVWANIGLQQLHLPTGEPEDPAQRVRGSITLDYPDLALLAKHLQALDVAFTRRPGGGLTVRCPHGNVFHLEQQQQQQTTPEPTWYGPRAVLPPVTGGTVGLPGPRSAGLGLRAVALTVPPGTAAAICSFYSELLGASVRVEPTPQQQAASGLQTCRVGIGYHQELRFEECAEPIDAYDGHHIAVYVNGFEELYERLRRRGLVWNNPRFPQFTYDSLEQAVGHREFRFKDIIHPISGEHLFTLEHEVRSLNHPGFSCPSLVVDAMEGQQGGSPPPQPPLNKRDAKQGSLQKEEF